MCGGRFYVGINLKAIASRQLAEGNVLPHGIAVDKTKVEEVIVELMTDAGVWHNLVSDL